MARRESISASAQIAIKKRNKIKAEKYSHEQLEQSIRNFQNKGGLIRKLPNEKIYDEWVVIPREKYNSPLYEIGFEDY